MTLTRFESEHELVVEAACRGPARVGTRITFAAETLPDWIRRGDRVVRVDDYTQERDAELAAQFGLLAAVAAPISVQGEVWGMLTGTSDAQPLPRGTEHRLQQFAELVAAALANSQARADLQALADEQTALRRIAELSAQEATADAVLQAVAVQASRLAGVEFGMVLRFVGPDGANEIVALDGAPANFTLGLRASGTGDGSVHRVWRTGRAARVDNLDAMSGRWPQMASQFGFSTSAGVPILLQEGELWGALIVAGRESMPAAIESHLADFAELASTAISAAHTRAQLRVLADEQAALRRVAELVARGAPLDEIFTATATEASKLLSDQAAVLLRYESDGHATVVAARNSPASHSGPSVTVPILVEGRAWGALSTSTAGPPLTVGTEDRLDAVRRTRRRRDRQRREQGQAHRLSRPRRRHRRRNPPPAATRPPRRGPTTARSHAACARDREGGRGRWPPSSRVDRRGDPARRTR